MGEITYLPPDRLTEISQAIWGQVLTDFDLNIGERFMLEKALRANDRLVEIQTELELGTHLGSYNANGAIVGLNPLLKAEKDQYSIVLRLWKSIGIGRQYLDVGRPPAGSEKRHKPATKLQSELDLDDDVVVGK